MRKHLLLAAAFLLPSIAHAQELSLGVGFNYSTGNYGTPTTTQIVSIPFTARYDRGPWNFKAILPYLRITGATSVVPGVGGVANSNPRGRGRGQGPAGATAAESTEAGMGDAIVAATYNVLYDNASKSGMDVTGKVKIATADADKGLGTGEHDVGAQLDVYRTYDRTTVFGGIGYTMLGSSNFIQLDNVWNVNAGGTYRLNERDSAGFSLDFRQAVSASASPQKELMAFWSRKLDKTWKAQVYALKGFSDGSPDWGAGASVAYAF